MEGLGEAFFMYAKGPSLPYIRKVASRKKGKEKTEGERGKTHKDLDGNKKGNRLSK